MVRHQQEDLQADQALISRQVDSLVVAVPENERPLSGLVGLLDWRFHGAISESLRAGAITGQPGECVYFPVFKNGHVYKLILAGAGKSPSPGERSSLPQETLTLLRKNIAGLKLGSVCVSRKDFGNPSEDFLSRHLKGIELKVTL
jgi:hypothetical protein